MRIILQHDIASRIPAALAQGKEVVVLSMRRERALLAACQAAAPAGAAGRVHGVLNDIVPYLSCRKIPPCLGGARAPAGEAGIKILLVSSGRTGSTLILDVLGSNRIGSAGEHLRPPVVLLHALGEPAFSLRRWYEAIVRIDSVDGVFSTKIAPHFFTRMWPRLSPSERAHFYETLQEYRIVHSYREDEVAQAVSLFRANRSTVWEVPSKEGIEEYRTLRPPPYDFEGLALEFAFIQKYNASVNQFLASLPNEKMGVSYEELAEDRAGCFQRLAAFMGVPDRLTRVETRFQKMADRTSIEMADRFRGEFLQRTGRRI